MGPSTDDDDSRGPAGPGSDDAVCEDLYCLSCGYNLRGLYGDPVRCPECGQSNDLGTARIPAEMIREALRLMETAPTLCVAWAVLFCVFSTFVLAGHWWMGGLSVIFAFAWLAARNRVRASFQDQPVWKSILRDFHLATMLCTLLIPLVLVLLMFGNTRRLPSSGILFVTAPLSAIPAFVWGLRIYYAARRHMAVARRDAAVRIARGILRRVLHRLR